MTENSETSEKLFRCLIAGGGTGGHLFPGIAVARELEARFEDTDILFAVGHRKLESTLLARYGYRTTSIDVEGIKGRGWKKGLGVMVKLPKSIFQSASIIRNFSPVLVLGMGGYSAGPVCLAARYMGIPTAIHEQNSYPGITNRLLSRIVDRVFISFDESRNHFKTPSLFLTGNPIRSELFSDSGKGPDDQREFTVLVVGGSQGAKAINQVFAETLAYMKAQGRKLEVIHQTGNTDYGRVVQDYRNRKLKGELMPFIQDMTTAYNRADLVVSRAGATTIFELAALGKPSILIPYPHATNQHQETNALSLVRAGGAEMIRQSELTAEGLSRVLTKYMDDRSALEEMGKCARKIARTDAAKVIVDKLLEMIK
jgi:UDP-N-acetylglucosamine--N-acetylmuramyl-(pentapeptide) pyrophosphoryl-undecaprenol N-acetylglucosamine transferase